MMSTMTITAGRHTLAGITCERFKDCRARPLLLERPLGMPLHREGLITVDQAALSKVAHIMFTSQCEYQALAHATFSTTTLGSRAIE